MRRYLFALIVGFIGLHLSRGAQARNCSGTNDHGCWVPLSGPNYSQVVVGKTANNIGIACAVQSPQPGNWGSVLECYSAVQSSGASLIGRGGSQIQPGLFVGTDPTRRIVSMAIEAGA